MSTVSSFIRSNGISSTPKQIDGIWFYTFEKAKDIILNYMLYDALWDGSKSIFEFLSSTFNVTY